MNGAQLRVAASRQVGVRTPAHRDETAMNGHSSGGLVRASALPAAPGDAGRPPFGGGITPSLQDGRAPGGTLPPGFTRGYFHSLPPGAARASPLEALWRSRQPEVWVARPRPPVAVLNGLRGA